MEQAVEFDGSKYGDDGVDPDPSEYPDQDDLNEVKVLASLYPELSHYIQSKKYLTQFSPLLDAV